MPTVSLTMPIILMLVKMNETSIKSLKNRDDTVPKTVETRRNCKED